MKVLTIFICCGLASVCLGAAVKPVKSPDLLGLSVLPENVAYMAGDNVTLICSSSSPNTSRIQWTEYAWTPQGGLISDNTQILTGHPQWARYGLLHPDEATFNLQIVGLVNEDNGTYECKDANDNEPNVYFGQAELVVLASNPNCTTTIDPSGTVLEGQYHTMECNISFAGRIPPSMTWSGPGTFNSGTSSGSTSVWAGISFYANRVMDARAFQCLTNFTKLPFIPPADTASNLPTWSYTWQSNQLFVYWGPQNLTYSPVKQYYEIGDNITCHADAWPAPIYSWANMVEFTISPGDTFEVNDLFEGTTTLMRCSSQNTIQGTKYTANLFVNITVPMRTTTTTPTTTPVPSTPPAVGICSDLSGLWRSSSPEAALCLSVNNSNSGMIKGLMKNNTDSVWIEIIGRTQVNNYDLLGFSGIWPLGIGVVGYVGECHNCYGVEQILVDGLIQKSDDAAFCAGNQSPQIPTPSYVFKRSSQGSCNPAELTIYNPSSISESLGLIKQY